MLSLPLPWRELCPKAAGRANETLVAFSEAPVAKETLTVVCVLDEDAEWHRAP